MKVVGTGLSGLVGTRLQNLFGSEHEFRNLDLSVGVDILNEAQVDEAVANSKAEVVVHMAAFTNVGEAHNQNGDEEGVCYKVNVLGTRSIARACEKYNKYLVHISTDYVFDGNKTEPYVEEDEANPIEWYGRTKFLAEKEVKERLSKYVILRLAFPYQANPIRPDFLEKIRENLALNKLPPAFVDHYITPTYADDFCTVINFCIKNQIKGIYHAVGSSFHSDYEIALMIKEIFSLEGEVLEGYLDEYLKKINRPYQKNMKVSNNKLTKDTGIQMSTLREGLSKVKQLC